MSRVLAFALACGVALPASAQSVFKWLDQKGNLHVTDTLSEVPQPYYGLYLAKQKALKEAGKDATPQAIAAPESAPSGPPPNTLPPSETESKRREAWKALVAHWRAELSSATAELQRLEDEAAQLQMNPVLRETPQVKAQLQAGEQDRMAARVRASRARQVLLEELPARAKRELVPPAWLL